MKTTSATGLSKGKNGSVAAKKAVLRAKEKLGGRRVDLSIVYSSSEYDHREVVDVVREATNNASLIGASTAGEFTEERVERGSVAVGLLSSDDIKIFTALAEGVKEEEYKIRWPSGINEDGSLNFKCGIAEGAIFRILEPGSSAAFIIQLR